MLDSEFTQSPLQAEFGPSLFFIADVCLIFVGGAVWVPLLIFAEE